MRKYFIVPVVSFLVLIFQCCSDPEQSIRIGFSGDLLLDRGVRKVIDAHGEQIIPQKLQPITGNFDYFVTNLECPVTVTDNPVNKKFRFRADPGLLSSLRSAGVTHLNLANNHSVDQGRSGLIETYDHIAQNDLLSIGFGKTHSESCLPAIIERQNITVAVFSSVLLPLENWMYLENEPSICQSSVESMAKSISDFKNKNPKTHVFVFLHWGVEYSKGPTSTQVEQAGKLIDSGADAIIGHHPHVIQTITSYKDKPVCYSLGNFVFDTNREDAQTGFVADFTVYEDSLTFTPVFYNIVDCFPELL